MTARVYTERERAHAREHTRERYARNRAMGLCRCGAAREDKQFLMCAKCRKGNYDRYQPKRGRLVPLAERVWSWVDKSGDCWVWTGTKHPKGYGQTHYKGRPHYAHRIVWELTNGPIPDGMLVCHRCDNPSCVRPDHLFLGTAQDNTDDMMRKGRHRTWKDALIASQKGVSDGR